MATGATGADLAPAAQAAVRRTPARPAPRITHHLHHSSRSRSPLTAPPPALLPRPAGRHLAPAAEPVPAPVHVYPAAVGAGAHPDPVRLVRREELRRRPDRAPYRGLEVRPGVLPGELESLAAAGEPEVGKRLAEEPVELRHARRGRGAV